MLIKNKIIVSIIISLIGLFISIYLISNLIANIYTATEERNQITNTLNSVLELDLLTTDYLLYGGERPILQWQNKYASIDLIFNQLKANDSNKQNLLNNIIQSSKSLKRKFENLQALRKNNNNENELILTEQEKRLVSQINTESHTLSAYTFELFDQVGRNIREMIVKAYIMGITAIILLISIILFLAWLFYFNLIKPLMQFNEKIKTVASGDYTARVAYNSKNELGRIARAFNAMVNELARHKQILQEKNEDLINSQKELEDQSDAVINILEDIEEEKDRSEDLAADLKKFKLAADNTSDQVVITDAEGIILYANQSLKTISGFTPEEVMGKKVATKSLWGGRMERDFYEKMWNVIKVKKQSFSGFIKNHHKNGQEYYVSATISPILDQKKRVRFFIGIERDATKEKEIDRAKSEFVSLASHQLRTPLTAINWYLEMLESEEIGKLNKKQKEYIGHAFASNHRMTELVSALLNVSRLELGTFIIEPKTENIKALADAVWEEQKHSAELKHLHLIKDFSSAVPTKVKLDKKLITICLQNLLSNAIKYTPAKGKVSFSIEKQRNQILITVADSGYGIPKDQHDKIFTKLFRADNIKSVDADGTGLGLYIVKSIVTESGGQVWFKSEQNKGSKFYISFPLTGMKAKKGTKSLD